MKTFHRYRSYLHFPGWPYPGIYPYTLMLKAGDVLQLTFSLVSGAAPTFNKHTLAGYHSFRYGPLILGYDGKEEIALSSQAKLVKEGKDTFKIQDKQVTLRPLRHLMSPEVSEAAKFSRQVLFKEP